MCYLNFCKLIEVIATISTFERHLLTEKRRGVHVGPDHHICNLTCDATHVLPCGPFCIMQDGNPLGLGFFLFLGERSSNVSEPFVIH